METWHFPHLLIDCLGQEYNQHALQISLNYNSHHLNHWLCWLGSLGDGVQWHPNSAPSLEKLSVLLFCTRWHWRPGDKSCKMQTVFSNEVTLHRVRLLAYRAQYCLLWLTTVSERAAFPSPSTWDLEMPSLNTSSFAHEAYTLLLNYIAPRRTFIIGWACLHVGSVSQICQYRGDTCKFWSKAHHPHITRY